MQDGNNQTHWLDPCRRVCRQIRPGVSGGGGGGGSEGGGGGGLATCPTPLYLGVKFYASDPCKLSEEITRYQFFLQVKLDVLQGRLPVAHELAVDLAALALQCEYEFSISPYFSYIKKSSTVISQIREFLW